MYSRLSSISVWKFVLNIITLGTVISVLLLDLSEGRVNIQIKEFTIPSQVAIHNIAHLSCQYEFGDDSPYSVSLYRDRRQFYRYMFDDKGSDENGRDIIIPVPGMNILAPRTTETVLEVTLQISGLEATGLYSCEITSDRTFMTTTSSREMQVVEELESESLQEKNEILNSTNLRKQGNRKSSGIKHDIGRQQLTLLSRLNAENNNNLTGTPAAILQEANLEFFHRQRAQLNLNLLNVIVPFFQHIQKNMTALVNLTKAKTSLADYTAAHDLIEDDLLKMEVNILRNRRSILQFSNAYENVEKGISMLSQTLEESVAFQSQL